MSGYRFIQVTPTAQDGLGTEAHLLWEGSGAGPRGSQGSGLPILKIVFVGLAAAAVLMAPFWLYSPEVEEDVETQVAEAPAPMHVSNPGAESGPAPGSKPATQHKRIEVREDGPLAKGQVRIQLLNEITGEPVPGINLAWTCRHPQRRHSLLGRTDADGSYLFEHHVGTAQIKIGRLLSWFGPLAKTNVEVLADKTVEEIICLPVQLNLDIQVVDPEGKPVPKARILAKRPYDGNLQWGVIGHTDLGGRWQHKSIHGGLFLAAEIDGRAPAQSLYLESKNGETVFRRLELGPRATRLAGTVIDVDGKPCAGARVVIQLPGRGIRSRKIQTISLKADERGRFVSSCVPPGSRTIYAFVDRNSLEARSANRRPRHVGRKSVEVPPAGLEGIELHLLRGATIFGRVPEPASRETPATRIAVHASLEDPGIPRVIRLALSGLMQRQEDGRYRIPNLLPGRYRLFLSFLNQELEPTVEHRVVLTDGQAYGWDPTLGVFRELRIKLVDSKGQALPSWFIRINSKGHVWHEKETDGEGRCHFGGLSSSRYSVLAFSPAKDFSVHTLYLRPGTSEHVIRVPQAKMPTAWLKGRIIARGIKLSDLEVTAGRRLPAHPMQDQWAHGRKKLNIDLKTGDFDYGPVTPGQYGVEVAKEQSPLGFSGIKNLVAHAKVDFGDIVVGSPSSLRVIARDTNGKQLRDLLVQGRVPPRGQWGQLPGEFDGQGFLVKRIPPLAFEILVSSPSTVPAFRSARIQPGRETRIEISCKKATPCAFSLPKDAKGIKGIQYASIYLRDAQGRTVVYGPINRKPGYRRLLRGLAPGSYNMEIRSGKTGKDITTSRITVPEQDTLFEILIGKQ